MATKILALAVLILIQTSQAMAQENLAPLVWATKNTGTTQQFVIDHYTSGSIKSIPGEDIRVPAPEANERTVIVGVLDTGIDYNHPQLKNVLAGQGYNAITPILDATDMHGHGTHVSGIIAAQLNERGFQGVSSHVKILPVKVIQTGPNAPIRPQDIAPGAGTGLTETVAAGLVWAINNGAEVINLSMAWPTAIHSKKVDDAMALAVQKNVMIVSSAGNDGTTADVYPCVYENVICVGSNNPDGTLSYFSNYGSMVDVSAPGISILSTWPLTIAPQTFSGQVGYEFRNGTSMSAPFVTGALAELLARGFSPAEAKARLFLASRPMRVTSLFSSDIVGQYPQNISTDTKNTRFGNIDLAAAVALTPSPLILPQKKGIYELDWDGVTQHITLPINWINRWVSTTGNVKITIQGQEFNFPSIAQDTSVITPVEIDLGSHPDHTLHLTASASTSGYQKSGIEITIKLVHSFTATNLPANAIVKTIHGLTPRAYSDIRSIVNVTSTNPRADLLFTRMISLPPPPVPVTPAAPVTTTPAVPLTRAQLAAQAAAAFAASQAIELTVVQDDTVLGAASLRGLTQSQFLNMYRLPDNTYAAIFTKLDPNTSRPNVLIERFDEHLKFVSEVLVGTDITVLPQNFVWASFKGNVTPLWMGLGYTPPKDLPAYNPWNPTFRDIKMPRIFYLDQGTLRITALADDELPLQILPDGKVLISKGSNYFQQYFILTLKDGQIFDRAPLLLTEYHMLIGLGVGLATLDLKGADPTMLAISGNSSPGNLRVTGVGSSRPSFDSILQRSKVLDTLVTISGAYLDSRAQYYFVQTHFDLDFFDSSKTSVLSTSMNRYSYTSTLASGGTVVPTIVKDQNGNGLPAIYVAASLTNGNTSQVFVADPRTNKIILPASLRLRVADGSCLEMGNLIPPRVGEPAKQVFICPNAIVQIPLVIEN